MSRGGYERWRDARSWDPSRETELVVQGDLAPAAWLEPLLVPGSFEVRMTVPQGFEAYARIFFPFVGADIVQDGVVAGQERVTWAEVARRNGRVAHALMEQETIGGGSETCCGELADEQLGALLRVLARHTSSPGAWFLLWDGFGGLNKRAFNYHGPKVRHPMRDYYLLRGPLACYGDFPHNPGYWWPDDRSWCWCTDIDFGWGYLAGSAACIEEVVAVPAIDALSARPDDPACSGMDIINDPGGTVARSP
jgi:hypothetical protein